MTPALWLLFAASLTSLAWQVRPVWVWLARAVVGRWVPSGDRVLGGGEAMTLETWRQQQPLEIRRAVHAALSGWREEWGASNGNVLDAWWETIFALGYEGEALSAAAIWGSPRTKRWVAGIQHRPRARIVLGGKHGACEYLILKPDGGWDNGRASRTRGVCQYKWFRGGAA